MHYKFPNIRNISQVRDAIEGCNDFIEVDRGDYIIFNYLLHTPETFPPVNVNGEYDERAAIRRECRGLMFGKDGKVLARRFHKFFNAEEKAETALDQIDLNRPHVILDKLDGSMITPIIFEGKCWWGTKMGITDIAFQVHVYVCQQPGGPYQNKYTKFALACYVDGCTPIFEWCSRKNRIVIDHPEDQLILTAIRNNEDGQYWTYEALTLTAESFGIPLVNAWTSGWDINQVIERVRQWDDTEGIVIRFDDGHMVKIKSDWYCKIHAAKDLLNNERKVVRLIIDQKIDDLYPLLLEHDRIKVQRYQQQFTEMLNTWVQLYSVLMKELESKYDRKTLALDYALKQNGYVRNLIFALWKRCSSKQVVYDSFIRLIQTSLGKTAKFEDLKKQFFPTLYYEDVEQ